jgi:hypothetical protein
MDFIPAFSMLAYFQNKFNDYYIVGVVDQVYNTLFPDDEAKKEGVCLFVARCYAGKDAYFQKEKIPLTAKDLKQKHPKASFIQFTDSPTSIKSQNKFIKKCVKKSRNSFLFYLRGGLNRAIKTKTGYRYEPIGLHRALLPLIHKQAKRYELDNKFEDFFLKRVWHKITEECNEVIINYSKYRKMLIDIALVVSDINDKEVLSKSDLSRLNKAEFIPEDPISEFVYSFLYEFKEYLKVKKLCGICPVCRKAFLYKYNKKFCSYRCGKRKQHKRYYQKYRFKILPKKIKEMRELRKTYKKHGIKK